MRLAASLLAVLVALFGVLPGPAAAASDPKVVLIVGPSGEATNRYRERAEAAARVAERYTSNVVRLYSPDATWPAVRRALDGAAIVVYLGHGNGWPSRYRDSQFGGTQNGFGLNPVAGGPDDAHQYFGEDRIASEVDLAKNAVVLLHHLCYASGNTEPGLPEGTVDQARQRVDNYAAGFIRAGAGAVVAEAHMGPDWYVERLLNSDRSIQRLWRSSPSVKGHEFSFESARSPGFTAAMDPDRTDGGFYRSIVFRGGVGGGSLTPAPASAPAVEAAASEPAEPRLVGTGFELRMPYFKKRPVAGSSLELFFPYRTNERSALDGLQVGARWDPLDVDVPPDGDAGGGAAEGATTGQTQPADAPALVPTEPELVRVEPQEPSRAPEPAAATEEPSPAASAEASPAASAEASGSPAAGPEASAPGEPGADGGEPADEPDAAADGDAAPAEPDAEAEAAPAWTMPFIQPEQLGSVVEPSTARVGKSRIAAKLTVPALAGTYRLVLTLHDSTGVAYDAPSQEIVPGLIVNVTGQLAVSYRVAPSVSAVAGETFRLPLDVANVGAETWGQVGSATRQNLEERPIAGRIAAHWVVLDAEEAAAAGPSVSGPLPAGLEPDASAHAVLDLVAPDAPGSYLLVLDVVIPGIGSLSAAGSDPALVRVTVE